MSILTDGPDWAPHVLNATQIANTGVPLTALPSLANAQVTASVAPGFFNIATDIKFTQIAYEVIVQVTSGTSATVPFVQFIMDWLDPTNAFVIATDTFTIPGANTGQFYLVRGRGPTKSATLNITLNNLDPVATATVTYRVFQHSRPFTTDRWVSAGDHNSGVTVPGFTQPTLVTDEAVQGILNGVTVAASSNNSWLHGMAPGQQVQLAGIASGITPASVVLIVTAPPAAFYTAAAKILHTPLTTATFSFTFTPPRSGILVEWANNATSGTLTVNSMMTAQS